MRTLNLKEGRGKRALNLRKGRREGGRGGREGLNMEVGVKEAEE